MSTSVIHKGLSIHYEGKVGFLNQDVKCDLEGWFSDAEMNWFFDAVTGCSDGLEEPEVPEGFHLFFKSELLPHTTWIPKTPESIYTITYDKEEPVR